MFSLEEIAKSNAFPHDHLEGRNQNIACGMWKQLLDLLFHLHVLKTPLPV